MSAHDYFDIAYTNDIMSSSAHGPPKATASRKNTVEPKPNMSFATPYDHISTPVIPISRQETRVTGTLSLAQILSIPVPNAKPPKLPKYLDCHSFPRIRDMPPAQPGHVTDTDMIISLVQSGAIEDGGYLWADATELQNWLVGELIQRLNHLLGMEVRRLPDGFTMPYLIRETKKAPRNIAALVRWCKTGRQRNVDFRSFPGSIERLGGFDFEYEISIHDITMLISEAKTRLDKPMLVTNATSATTTPEDRMHRPLTISLWNSNRETHKGVGQKPKLIAELASKSQFHIATLVSKPPHNPLQYIGSEYQSSRTDHKSYN